MSLARQSMLQGQRHSLPQDSPRDDGETCRLVVKNTFIDVEDAKWVGNLVQRRSKSAPRFPCLDPATEPFHNRVLQPVVGCALPTSKDQPGWQVLGHTARGKEINRLVDHNSKCHDQNSDNVKTTVILRNLPEDFNRDMLLRLLDSEGFFKKYDFVYLPLRFELGTSFGYAFINLINSVEALRFQKHFAGFHDWGQPNLKATTVGWSHELQGLEDNVARYRNSQLMHRTTPDELRPVMFEDGVRVPLPPPTRPIIAPRIRRER